MTDRSILMSGPMVRALLEDRKTQTRRLAWRRAVVSKARAEAMGLKILYGRNAIVQLPTIWQKVRPGDRLWVQETYYLTDDGHSEFAVYATDELEVARHINKVGNVAARHGLSEEWLRRHVKRRPSTHMPRWASRITLLVTETRLERVQEISRNDCGYEGFRLGLHSHAMPDPYGFREYWKTLHGPGSWDANPEVVPITFDVRQQNIDTLEVAA